MFWFVGAMLVFAAAVSWHIWPRDFWALGLLAAIVSQLAISSAWPDAKFGTIANVLLLIASTIGFLMYRPTSLHAQFVRDSSARSTSAANLVTEADLDPLPEPVKRYLRAVGVCGQRHKGRPTRCSLSSLPCQRGHHARETTWRN